MRVLSLIMKPDSTSTTLPLYDDVEYPQIEYSYLCLLRWTKRGHVAFHLHVDGHLYKLVTNMIKNLSFALNLPRKNLLCHSYSRNFGF